MASIYGTFGVQGYPKIYGLRGARCCWAEQWEQTQPESRGGDFPEWMRVCFGDVPCKHVFNFLWRGERICQMRLILETSKAFSKK